MDALTFHLRPSVAVLDRSLFSHTTSFQDLGRIHVAVAGVGVVTDIGMEVEVVSVRCPDYLEGGCIDLGAAVDSLCQRNSYSKVVSVVDGGGQNASVGGCTLEPASERVRMPL